MLGYFKYTNFLVENINAIFENDYHLNKIILPLAISFFTFQQIAYLVDAYRGETKEYNFLHYCLFVTFFPQLIAGPIVHHREMLPQFASDLIYKLNFKHISVGFTIFILGLFKKVVLADGVSVYATPVFIAADSGITITFLEAWCGALAYTLQLYFDFSGYSDMAIGIARMFGVRLPLNFNSPYKAKNIVEFWRRWHMTLSRFLRDYLYIPLGGSRRGPIRRYINLMTTMILGGLWHGAGWSFAIWGALHGAYLIINHAWSKMFHESLWWKYVGKYLAWPITFLSVVVAWIPFRAETLSGAKNIWLCMAGQQGFSLPVSYFDKINRLNGFGDYLISSGWSFIRLDYFYGPNEVLLILLLLFIIIFMPNTQQFLSKYRPALETYKGEIEKISSSFLSWRPTIFWALLISMFLIVSVLGLSSVSEFLYFRF